MSFDHDPELRELFREEVSQRVAELVEGARQMQQGPVSNDVAGSMFREGHTIKGTSRVMGVEGISRAGQALETVWRQVQHGDVGGNPALGKALEDVAAAIPAAYDSASDDALNEALARLNDVLGDPGDKKSVAIVPEAPAEQAGLSESGELGGLLGALDTWASEETVWVNSAEMYRLINSVAALGVYASALHGMVLDLEDSHEAQRLSEAVKSIERTIDSAKLAGLSLASAQLREATNSFPQLVAYLAKKTGKEVRFELVGDEETVDRQILDRVGDALRQLIVNAVEHGIESPEDRAAAGKQRTATLAIRACKKDNRLEVTVEDDGGGVDWGTVHRTAVRQGLLPDNGQVEEGALRALLFAPGFSTASQPSELVGDGSGLTMVASAVEELRGSIDLETEPGSGTSVTLVVPTSRALQDAVLVEAGGHHWGIPEASVVDIIPVDASALEEGSVTWQEHLVPVVPFAAAAGLAESSENRTAVVIRSQLGPIALTVHVVIGQQEVAAKELGPLLSGAPHLTGAALLGDGDIVVLVDPVRLAERARELPSDDEPQPRVLVVDDSPGARQVVAGALASNGFNASVAESSEQALAILRDTRIDALVVDFSMPGSDGISLVNEVRRTHGPLPIIMLSGVAAAEDQARAREAGVNAYFDKNDFREGALAATLVALVNARESEEPT